MQMTRLKEQIRTSLPAWGVWIEMQASELKPAGKYGRSPHGECGLKFCPLKGLKEHHMSLPAWGVWIEMFSSFLAGALVRVAPRMGSVD